MHKYKTVGELARALLSFKRPSCRDRTATFTDTTPWPEKTPPPP